MSDAIYEPAYEAYEGERTPAGARVAAIARRSLGRVTDSTWLWVLAAATLVHVGVRGVVLYVTGQVDVPPGGPSAALAEQLRFDAGFLTDALALQARWMMALALVTVGADAIAEDLEAGGLTFYFSKPVTRSGYLAGKLAGPLAAGLALTALPAIVLWVLGLAFTPEAAYPAGVWTLPWALLAGGLLASLVASLVVLALSALLGSRWPAALTWIGIAVILAGAANVARAVTGNADAQLLDLFSALERISEALAGLDASAVPLGGAVLVVAGWTLAALAGLAWTLSREEVGA